MKEELHEIKEKLSILPVIELEVKRENTVQRQLALLRQGMDKGHNTTKTSKLAFWVWMMEVETTHR
jgi:hypothetical protein